MSDPGLVADRLEGIPHPGECKELLGHDAQVGEFLKQFAVGKMHHAHLVTGPKGVGKASFAMRMASHLFRYADPTSAAGELYPVETGDPIDGKIAARAHPNLLHMTRPWDEKAKKFKTQLTVDEIRNTVSFFGTSRGEDGWRVAIVDAADDMNANASNALLKVLEEPPERTVFFVLSHSAAKVLPTIKSRCQQLLLKPLADDLVIRILNNFGLVEELSESDQVLLAKLSRGSVRNGIILTQEDGLTLYKSFAKLCASLEQPDWVAVHGLADSIAARGKEDKFKLVLSFAEEYMESRATGAHDGQTNISVLARWAEVWEKTRNSIRIADAYNLDRKQLVLNLFQDMGEVARG